ncbi:hypothetical protein CN563_11610 [Bacillus sp. AFS026049]|nr:hypothetical protein CON84_14210 [Bacillus sp. AFS094228]PEO47451.1 hypothetical protein CN563_11610 [Bacillus sp. AFS026049]
MAFAIFLLIILLYKVFFSDIKNVLLFQENVKISNSPQPIFLLVFSKPPLIKQVIIHHSKNQEKKKKP